MTADPAAGEQEAELVDETPQRATADVLAAARLVGLAISPQDLPAVTAHLALLREFAAVVGEPASEPAPVFRP